MHVVQAVYGWEQNAFLSNCIASIGVIIGHDCVTTAFLSNSWEQLQSAYISLAVPWSAAEVNEGWGDWIIECLDGKSMGVMSRNVLSLAEVVLD